MKKIFFSLCILSLLVTNMTAQSLTVYDSNGNPNVRVSSYGNGTIQMAVADCYGCYSNIAETGDVVLRADGSATGRLIISSRSDDPTIFTTGNWLSESEKMRLTVDGKLQIGSVSSSSNEYKLFVQSGILTEKVKVAVSTSSNWADYVFDKKYNLMSLKEVEKFITKNKHLPNVPSAIEVVKEGIDLAKMDAKLLEKIEELTLYMIKLNKEVEKLKEENKLLKDKH